LLHCTIIWTIDRCIPINILSYLILSYFKTQSINQDALSREQIRVSRSWVYMFIVGNAKQVGLTNTCTLKLLSSSTIWPWVQVARLVRDIRTSTVTRLRFSYPVPSHPLSYYNPHRVAQCTVDRTHNDRRPKSNDGFLALASVYIAFNRHRACRAVACAAMVADMDTGSGNHACPIDYHIGVAD